MVTNIGKEEYMVEQPKLSIHDESEDSNIKIRTDKAQKVDMFGGAITHSTAHLLLEDDTRIHYMKYWKICSHQKVLISIRLEFL